jgi:acyl dehydratase
MTGASLRDLTPPPAAAGLIEPTAGTPWEDAVVGTMFRTSARTVTEHDLMAFVTTCGLFEPLFLNANDPGNDPRRLVPGLLTLSLAEGLVFQSRVLHRVGVALLSLDVSMRAPVRVGDTLDVVVHVTGVDPTSTNHRARVTTENWVYEQGGAVVLVYRVTRLVRGRGEL